MTVYVIVKHGYFYVGEKDGKTLLSQHIAGAKEFDTLAEAVEANTGRNGKVYELSLILKEVEV